MPPATNTLETSPGARRRLGTRHTQLRFPQQASHAVTLQCVHASGNKHARNQSRCPPATRHTAHSGRLAQGSPRAHRQTVVSLSSPPTSTLACTCVYEQRIPTLACAQGPPMKRRAPGRRRRRARARARPRRGRPSPPARRSPPLHQRRVARAVRERQPQPVIPPAEHGRPRRRGARAERDAAPRERRRAQVGAKRKARHAAASAAAAATAAAAAGRRPQPAAITTGVTGGAPRARRRPPAAVARARQLEENIRSHRCSAGRHARGAAHAPRGGGGWVGGWGGRGERRGTARQRRAAVPGGRLKRRARSL